LTVNLNSFMILTPVYGDVVSLFRATSRIILVFT